ncbi:MAG: hypothetical protein JNK35_02045 [Phycisphaerae bacterium]|nr:hypothetical protein [Phycisphaerae bacterium]
MSTTETHGTDGLPRTSALHFSSGGSFGQGGRVGGLVVAMSQHFLVVFL